MELLVIVIVAFLIGKAVSKKKNRKDESVGYGATKKKGCFSRLISVLFKFFLVIVLLAFITSISSKNNESDAPISESVVAPIESEPIINPTEIPSTAPTIVPSAAPITREEWVLAAAKEVYGDELISVEWQEIDNQKDMIVIWCDFVDNFTNQMRRDRFMLRAKNMFKHISQLGKDNRIEYGSCYIVARTTYLDKYNNEFEGNAMEIRLLEKDLSKLNWDNYMNDETIINLATTYAVHPLFRN